MATILAHNKISLLRIHVVGVEEIPGLPAIQKLTASCGCACDRYPTDAVHWRTVCLMHASPDMVASETGVYDGWGGIAQLLPIRENEEAARVARMKEVA